MLRVRMLSLTLRVVFANAFPRELEVGLQQVISSAFRAWERVKEFFSVPLCHCGE